jgi:hypothetical protein
MQRPYANRHFRAGWKWAEMTMWKEKFATNLGAIALG